MLVLKALIALFVIEVYLLRGNFASLYRKVRACRAGKVNPRLTAEELCAAFEFACLLYPKQALCLQRSSALTCLLRRHGVPANLIIGAQQLPFRAHAWVELEGRVINDKPYMRDVYAVLETC